MGQTVFRRNPAKFGKGNFKNIVRERANLMNQKQHISGKTIQSRNPAYVYITGTCKTCTGGSSMTLPKDLSTWNETYKPTSHIKPAPMLTDVKISFGGDWGLAQKISATIRCFDKDSFKQVQDAFLYPGNDISVRFGYATGAGKQWTPGNDQDHKLKNFRVAVFSFSAGDDGTWVGSFTAVRASEAINIVDLSQGVGSSGLSDIKYKVGRRLGGEESVNVDSIAELIISDGQRNGEDSKIRVGENESGYVIGNFEGYSPSSKGGMARMVVYVDDHLRNHNVADGVKNWFKNISDWTFGYDEVESLRPQIYVTLGYVTDRIINGLLKKSVEKGMQGTDQSDFEKLKIKYHPDYSKSKLPELLESGDPKSVLILGRGAKFKDAQEGTEMDFNKLQKFEGASAKDVIAYTDELELDKILLHKDLVLSAFGAAEQKQETSEAESTDPKNTEETVVKLQQFMTEMFVAIKSATGGALSLRLILDPDDLKGESLIVVDQNYAGDNNGKPLEVFVFNPIDGDGSTRSCNISSNAGSNEYRTAMFISNSKKGDPVAKIRGCDGDLQGGRNKQQSKAKERHKEIVSDPGSMMLDSFNSKQIDAFKSVMTDLYRYSKKSDTRLENIHWPGMSIDITINGAFGIVPGCAVATTQMPNKWINQGIYFLVTDVEHNFSRSDWTTNIRGILSFYDDVDIIRLNA